MSRRRRRRGAAQGWAPVEDAFDLFLDALANTLGVIMFIALMVVLFAAPPDAPGKPREPRTTVAEAERVAELLDRRDRLEQELASLPPQGDPELLRQLTAIERALREVRESLARALQASAEMADALRATRAEVLAMKARTRSLAAQQREVERRTADLADASSFVRVSRFRDDPRRPLLLLVSEQLVERADPQPGERSLRPGRGARRPLDTIDEARAALPELLRGTAPVTHRIEVGVWADSFAAYKRLERVLVEAGYDINPLPVPIGEALGAGASGIQ